ncbi:DNA polymerase III subunit chi [Psychrobacter sp. I-STPA6b]|uniref:DNA polymerase III subunit chi n=1 Tax=Psychrobacter sp. I-STPA6b TaxID=2585718 RepID=UPI001D0C36C3|nr:DNA polymerase III subunit chi [Psychrobacter sp. I-STPA6b]
MQVSFYLLSHHKVPNAEALVDFVCHLIQTAQQKSEQGTRMLIIDDDEARLQQLDDKLWSFSATSFLPHTLITASDTVNDTDISDINNDTNIITTANTAPILLSSDTTYAIHTQQHQSTSHPEQKFHLLINLAQQPIKNLQHSDNQPNRLLEIIAPDDASVQQGREKYRFYQQLGFALNHFKL